MGRASPGARAVFLLTAETGELAKPVFARRRRIGYPRPDDGKPQWEF